LQGQNVYTARENRGLAQNKLRVVICTWYEFTH